MPLLHILQLHKISVLIHTNMAALSKLRTHCTWSSLACFTPKRSSFHRTFVSRPCINQKFNGIRSASTILVHVWPFWRTGNHCSQDSGAVLYTFGAGNVSAQQKPPCLNHLQHWNVLRVVVYFRVGDMRCIRNAQYFLKATPLPGTRLRFQVFSKRSGLFSTQEHAQNIWLKHAEFRVQPNVILPYSLLKAAQCAHAIPGDGYSPSDQFHSHHRPRYVNRGRKTWEPAPPNFPVTRTWSDIGYWNL